MNGEMQSWRGLEDRRSHVEASRENATRPARHWALYKTTNTGAIVEDKVFAFDGAFLSLPIFTFGVLLDTTSARYPDLPLDDPPRCTAGVYDWKLTAKGLYSGAFCWFTVESDTTTFGLKMIFTLSWEGVASKNFIATPGFPVSTLDIV